MRRHGRHLGQRTTRPGRRHTHTGEPRQRVRDDVPTTGTGTALTTLRPRDTRPRAVRAVRAVRASRRPTAPKVRTLHKRRGSRQRTQPIPKPLDSVTLTATIGVNTGTITTGTGTALTTLRPRDTRPR
ncbi:hypothetical protein ABZV75_40105, partial [Streptomyces flaveolus]|uniref:hypothetical protein n=1 Tax=Streptomyces flaveolus TaxID=67297 RepID=UPI0033AA2218